MLGDSGVFPAQVNAKIDTSDVFDPSQVADIERQQASLGDLAGYREIPNPDLAAAIGQALSEVAAGTLDPAAAMANLQAAAEAL
jgi:raffinose/stachyose/melibiose transport system substrate-binding protein